MAFGKLVGEALTEGLVFKLLLGAWDLARDMLTDEVKSTVKEKLKKVIDTKGWEDEHYFALDLAQADIDNDSRDVINKGVMLAEQHDKDNGTKSARHFRIIVTLRDKDEGVDPLNRPGMKILKHIADSCADENAVFVTIQVIGAMHDSNFSMESMMHLVKESWFPFLKAKAISAYGMSDCRLNTWATKIGEEEDAELLRGKAIESMPAGYKKRFAKIGFELLKYIKN